MGGLTEDPNDPNLNAVGEDGQQASYLVLSAEERSKGFVRPVRTTYRHTRCGAQTTMSTPLAETYARNPHFYGATFCATCHGHFPVGQDGEFTWIGLGAGEKVGT